MPRNTVYINGYFHSISSFIIIAGALKEEERHSENPKRWDWTDHSKSPTKNAFYYVIAVVMEYHVGTCVCIYIVQQGSLREHLKESVETQSHKLELYKVNTHIKSVTHSIKVTLWYWTFQDREGEPL